MVLIRPLGSMPAQPRGTLLQCVLYLRSMSPLEPLEPLHIDGREYLVFSQCLKESKDKNTIRVHCSQFPGRFVNVPNTSNGTRVFVRNINRCFRIGLIYCCGQRALLVVCIEHYVTVVIFVRAFYLILSSFLFSSPSVHGLQIPLRSSLEWW